MGEVTSAGVRATSLADWILDLQAAFRAAFGSALEFDAGSVQQQLVGTVSEPLAEVDEALVAIQNGLSRLTAAGYQLDAGGSWVGHRRREAVSTSVNLTLRGVAGTMIPSGRRVQSTDGVLLRTNSDATLNASGTMTVDAVAVVPGAVPVLAGTVTRIVDVVNGWESVTNSQAGIIGTDRETDAAFRLRQHEETYRAAVAPLDAVVTAVRQVSGVTKAAGQENPTDTAATIGGVSINARSLYVVVKGGNDNDIAEAIYNAKTAGSITQGGVAVNLSRGNWTVPINFTRPTEVAIAITVTINLVAGFPSDGLAQIRQRLADLVAGLGIGELLHDGEVYVAMLSVPGFRISGAVALAREGSGSSLTPVLANEVFTLNQADVTITVA